MRHTYHGFLLGGGGRFTLAGQRVRDPCGELPFCLTFGQPHTIHALTALDGPRGRPGGSQSGRGFFFLTPFDPSLSSLLPCHINLQLYKLQYARLIETCSTLCHVGGSIS